MNGFFNDSALFVQCFPLLTVTENAGVNMKALIGVGMNMLFFLNRNFKMLFLKIIVNESNMPENTQTIRNENKFQHITKVSVNLQLPDIGVCDNMR